MSIEKAYCLQMNKRVTSSQARVAFLSSENTSYNKFSFYCIYCGLRLSGANVHKREELTRKNRTSHFKKYSKKESVKHTNPKCLKYNTNISTNPTGHTGKKGTSGNLIVYTKFKLSQIDYEIVKGLNTTDPDFMPISVTSTALDSEIECDIHTTSILKDLVNCFNELEAKESLDEYPLHIEGDQLKDNTYATVFRGIVSFNKIDKNRKKLNELNDNFFQFRVLYGATKNDFIKKELKGWSFLIDFNEQYFFRDYINNKEQVRPMLVRIFISTEVLSKYSQLRDQYLKDEKNKLLDLFYITNCKPEIQALPNNKGSGTHDELVFNIKNLHHIHLTFKDSK